MSITVERVYRVTIAGEAHLFGGEEAECLAFGLLAALGYPSPLATDGALRPVQAVPIPPAALSAGPLIAANEPEQTRADRFHSVNRWTAADTDRLRALAADGMTGPQIARLMDKPRGTIGAQASKHHIPLSGGKPGPVARVPDADPIAIDEPPPALAMTVPDAPVAPTPAPVADAQTPRVVTIREADPLAEQVLTGPLREWTLPDTQRLVAIMHEANTTREIDACAERAAAALGRTAMSCKNRWGHLKKAGQTAMRHYLSDPESLPERESEDVA